MEARAHRWLAAIAVIAGCAVPDSAPDAPPPSRGYAPPVRAWGIGAELGPLGRGEAPQLATELGISGALPPLADPTLWQVPGDGAPSAIADGAGSAVERIDIDGGRVAWRGACGGRVEAIAADAVICVVPGGVRALAVADGAARWAHDGALVTVTGDRVVVARDGGVVVLDAARGAVLADVALPAAIAPGDVRASCGADGRELFALTHDDKLARLVAPAAGTAKLAWAVAVSPRLDTLDACSGDSVRVRALGDVSALARATGKETGRVHGVRGVWPARDGSARVEIADATGVASWPADLSGDERMLPLPALGELLAMRGDRRLVRASADTAVLLDARGVRAYLELAAHGAPAFGERAVVAGTGAGVRRFALPPRFTRRLRVGRAAGVAVAAELRDLPERAPAAAGVLAPGIGSDDADHGVLGVVLDPDDPAVLYAELGAPTDGGRPAASLARLDLRARTWGWTRRDVCEDRAPPATLVAARGVLACAAGDRVRATTSATGAAAWEWRAAGQVDALAAAGDVIVAFAADRAAVLDARTGALLGHLASDDAGAVRAAPLAIAGASWLVAVERGRLVTRLPRVAMQPVWSRALAGAVRAVHAAGDAVLVDFDDGDAYRVDARTGAVVAMAGLGQRWTTFGDVLVGATAGGPIPPADPRWVPPPPKPPPAPRVPPPPPKLEIESPPPFTTYVWPPPPAMDASFEITLYDPTGAPRARNDYALPIQPSVMPAGARGPAGSPFVLVAGDDQLLVIDAARGDPVRRVTLRAGSAPFATVVDGVPTVGAVAGPPLRLVLFSPAP